jgi:ATP-dependent exoDNAse (exonuclease V) alpha subunit
LGQKFVEDDFIGVKKFGNNCLLVACPQEKMEKGYNHYYERMIKTYGVDGVLVLTPTKRGKLGTHAVNRTLQEIVNPLVEFQDEIRQIKDGEEMLFRLKDNVINTVNSYKMKDVDDEEVDIMNGETGIITHLDLENRSIVVRYDDLLVVTPSADLEKILHSYCVTMHKIQGSSCRSIISITDRAHTHQLNANLIYTAWTRPEEFLVILCQPAVINNAMRKVENLRRNTFLCEILKDEIEYKSYVSSDSLTSVI